MSQKIVSYQIACPPTEGRLHIMEIKAHAQALSWDVRMLEVLAQSYGLRHAALGAVVPTPKGFAECQTIVKAWRQGCYETILELSSTDDLLGSQFRCRSTSPTHHCRYLCDHDGLYSASIKPKHSTWNPRGIWRNEDSCGFLAIQSSQSENCLHWETISNSKVETY